MWLFGYLALLFLCGTLEPTLGSSAKSIQSMSIEEAVIHLDERISLSEKRLLEEKNELATRISEMEAAFANRQNDLSSKLDELAERTSKQREEISNVSERLQNEKVRLLLVDNQFSMEVNQLQRRALETFEKMNNMRTEISNVSETARIKTDLLQVQINETRDLVQSCVASQGEIGSAISKNMSSSVEKLTMQVNDSLTLRLENMQLNMTTNIRKLENSLLLFRESCVNPSYASTLEESFQNLSRATKSELRSIRNDLHPRITLLEGRSDSTNDVAQIKKVLTNHTSEIGSLNARLFRVQNRCSDPPYVGDLYPVFSGLGGRDHGAVATYDCRGNKIPAGNKVVECRVGKWIGELPQCVDPVCEPPCQNGGTCLKNDTCSCTPLFSGSRCQYDHSRCGLDLRNVGGNGNNTPAWPWMAALYVPRSENDPVLKFTCGGSIIDRHFILTSARCVHTSTGLIKSSDFKVRLGLTDVDDLTHLQEHSVQTIYSHPRFWTHDKYDYDIALLKLETPIDYNLYVRPVCLPPTDIPKDNIFYKTQSTAQAIGFGHDKVVPKDYKLTRYLNTVRLLKDIDLVIQAPDICRSSLVDDNKANRLTDRMFCAAQEKSFACMGDSGGPAMQSRLHEEGIRSWTQVGIVSWFVGCGLEGEYGFFTHLQKLMPWVDSVFEAAFPPTPINIDF